MKKKAVKKEKTERESIGTAAMHPMALAHMKSQKVMKKAVMAARKKAK